MSAEKELKQLSEPKGDKKPIFKERLFEEDEDPATFKNQLIAISDSHGEEEHYKPFTKEQKVGFKYTIVDMQLEIRKLTKEKKDFVKSIDGVMKPLKVLMEKTTENLASGSVWTKEVLYHQVDHESGMIGSYDDKGILQYTKQLKRGRGLQKMIPLILTASNNVE